MSKHTIKGFLYYVQYEWDAPNFSVTWSLHAEMGKTDPNWTLIDSHDIEVEIPDNFDPRPAKLAALRKLKQDVKAEFAAKVVEIDRRINELLAIEA
jgi:hypothetical protein